VIDKYANGRDTLIQLLICEELIQVRAVFLSYTWMAVYILKVVEDGSRKELGKGAKA
jgi:hypothetical protein